MMTAAEWWGRARSRYLDGDLTTAPEDILAFLDLSTGPGGDRERIGRRVKVGLHSDDPSVRAFAWKVAEDIAVATMNTYPASDHLRAEIAYARLSGRTLAPGAAVPGCGCAQCTGLGDAPLAVPAPDFSRWEDAVERARAVPLLEVVHRLGLGEAKRKGRRWWMQCPFHEDRTPCHFP